MGLSSYHNFVLSVSFFLLPASSGAFDVVSVALDEFTAYGGLNECTDDILRDRIGEYWSFLGFDESDGCGEMDWSAAFISYLVNLAGGGDGFAYTSDHSVYIQDAFNGGGVGGGTCTRDEVPYVSSATDTITCPPKPGDILCYGIGSQNGWNFVSFENWFDDTTTGSRIDAHCDVVVNVTTAFTSYEVTTIGGDLEDSITQRTFTETEYQDLYTVRLTLGARPTDILDVVFCTDISGSFEDDIRDFREAAPTIICDLLDRFPNVQFAQTTFSDYPFSVFGSFGQDLPYVRDQDLTTLSGLDGTKDAFLEMINSLTTNFGGDEKESQLVAMYQIATGAGQVVDLEPYGGTGTFEIPAGQGISFRDDAIKIIILWTDAAFHSPETSGTPIYPGPSFDEAIAPLLAFGDNRGVPRVIGLTSPAFGIDDPNLDIGILANATGAVAGEAGIDCDGDGIADIAEGEPIICSSDASAGLAMVITTVVEQTVDNICNSTQQPTRPPTSPEPTQQPEAQSPSVCSSMLVWGIGDDYTCLGPTPFAQQPRPEATPSSSQGSQQQPGRRQRKSKGTRNRPG